MLLCFALGVAIGLLVGHSIERRRTQHLHWNDCMRCELGIRSK
jgi:hypothetical protein